MSSQSCPQEKIERCFLLLMVFFQSSNFTSLIMKVAEKLGKQVGKSA